MSEYTNNEMFSEMKKCSQCGEEKLRTPEFYNRNKNSKDGLKPACKECIKLYRMRTKDAQDIRRKRHFDKNREKIREQQRLNAIKNRDIKKEYDKKYSEENKERITARQKKYYNDNFERIQQYHKERNADPEYKARRREYRKTRKERDAYLFNEWRLKNTKRISTNKQRRHSRQKGLKSTFTHNEWLEAIDAFDGLCAYCGEDKELTRDHFIPVTSDGEFTVENIIPACRSCNSSKNNTEFFEWYRYHDEIYCEDRERKIIEYLGYVV